MPFATDDVLRAAGSAAAPKLEIRHGRLIDPASGLDQETPLYLAEGRIVALGQAPAGWQADTVLDARGWVVAPGLVDASARLREPGYEYMATLETELAAAAAGGVTSLACPPDTDPALDEPGLVEMLKHRARQLGLAHVYPLGALTQGLRGEQITEMVELAEAGCVAFAQADVAVTDTRVLLRAMQYAATFGYSVWLRPQDHWLARDGVAHDGEVATRMGLNPIPVCAETIALNTMLALAQETQCRLHVCRLSSAVGVDMVRQAKARGLAVTADVAVHHLHLSDNDIGFFDPMLHLVPPLRTPRDREALWQGLADGTIDAICSDHTPVDEDAKLVPFAESEPGATGLELLLPLTLMWAQARGLSLPAALAPVTCQPARLLGLEAGRLVPGAVADLCLFNPETLWQPSPSTLHSLGRNTPYLGRLVQGQVEHTLLAGRTVYQRATS